MDDKCVTDWCFKARDGTTTSKAIKNRVREMPEEMRRWLMDERFKDDLPDDLHEAIHRVRLGIEVRPKCKVCGQRVKHLHCGKFRETCSTKCAGKSSIEHLASKLGIRSVLSEDSVAMKAKETMMSKYSVDNASKSDAVKQKKVSTHIEHYGNENNFCNKGTRIKAIENSRTEDAKQKRKKTCKEKYGVNCYLESNRGKHLSPEHKEKISRYMKSREGQEKRHATLSKNNTWNKSKFEEGIYSKLCEMFGKDMVVRQHSDEKYPWKCDFYIKAHDLYIEAQGSQFHHFKPFDANSPDDLAELARIESLGNAHKQYKKIAETWAKMDVVKRQHAREMNLNFIEVFPSDDVTNLIESFKHST